MKSVSRWTVRDVPLLFSAVLTVITFRLLLYAVALRRLRSFIDRTPLRLGERKPVDPLRISRAVVSAAHRIPHANCLPRALATQWLLRRRGIASELRLGAARDAAGAFTAHAWLTHNGTIIVGELADQMNFTAFSSTGILPVSSAAK